MRCALKTVRPKASLSLASPTIVGVTDKRQRHGISTNVKYDAKDVTMLMELLDWKVDTPFSFDNIIAKIT